MGAKKLTSENLREKNGSKKTHLRKSKGKKWEQKKLTSENLREKTGSKQAHFRKSKGKKWEQNNSLQKI